MDGKGHTMKSDSRLQRQVIAALDQDPNVEGTAIGVCVKGDVVSLFGHAQSLEQAAAAERAAKQVAGVRALTNEIEVDAQGFPYEPRDHDVARAIRNHCDRRVHLHLDRILVTVRNGVVTLEGEVNWLYQAKLVEQQVLRLGGVKTVLNLLRTTTEAKSEAVETGITKSSADGPLLDARELATKVGGQRLALVGQASS
jgi:osmotically-inducible protein OsmY